MTSTLLRGGWVLEEDGTTRQQRDVLVEDGVIAAVGSGLDAEAVLDCAGGTVMPGVVDAHVHLAMAGSPQPDASAEATRQRVAANARALLLAGVTTARDAGGPSDVLLAQRDRCAADPAAGPQLLLCCEGIATVGGHGTEFTGATIVREVDGPATARAAVRRLVEIGADWVKVMLNGADQELELGEAELRAIVEQARVLGIPVAAHASNEKAVALAVACGVDSIEHGNGLDESLTASMARQGTALVTTTYLYRVGAGCAHSDVDYIGAFAPEVQDKVRGIMAGRMAAHEKALPAAARAGTPVVLGTDAVVGPVALVAEELLALTAIGLTPAQALVAATAAGAELLRLTDRGRVAVGLRADLVVVAGRPDEDVAALGEPRHVLRGGTLIDSFPRAENVLDG